MKIKCVCGNEIDSETDFFHHINEKHGYRSIHILYNLLFKIHEKIESLSESGGERIWNDYEIALLIKSLLENEK